MAAFDAGAVTDRKDSRFGMINVYLEMNTAIRRLCPYLCQLFGLFFTPRYRFGSIRKETVWTTLGGLDGLETPSFTHGRNPRLERLQSLEIDPCVPQSSLHQSCPTPLNSLDMTLDSDLIQLLAYGMSHTRLTITLLETYNQSPNWRLLHVTIL